MTTNKTRSAPPDATPRSNTRSARRRAREFALQGVYAWLVRGDQSLRDAGDIDAHVRDNDGFRDADVSWYDTLLHGVLAQAPDLRARFTPYIDRSINELSPIEHGILLMGCYELVHHIEVPYRVVINEAVELGKSFGGTDGFKFVNGVLDKVAADVRPVEIQAARRPQRS